MAARTAAQYAEDRAKNIASNKALLESLGLDDLKLFPPAAVSAPNVTKATAKAPAKPKAPKPAQKRKRDASEEIPEDGSADGDYKAPKVEPSDSESEEDNPRRATRRRAAKRINYNEDNLEKEAGKRANAAKVKGERLLADVDGRIGNRVGTRKHNPKVFGSIPGVEVGTVWETRMACSRAAIHAPPVGGIAGSATEGAYSVALSGGYEDDVDLGYAFTYTGSGGRDLSGTADAPKNLRTAGQSDDQSFGNSNNAALLVSSQTGRPVRVIRGYKLGSIYSPPTGYRYDGLYVVEKAWMAEGLEGFKVCRYALKRLPDQAPIPQISVEEAAQKEIEADKARKRLASKVTKKPPKKASKGKNKAEDSDEETPPPPSPTEGED